MSQVRDNCTIPIEQPEALIKAGRHNERPQENYITGTIVSKEDEIFRLEFENSDIFWDESIYFSHRGNTLIFYRLPELDQFQVGDRVLIKTSHAYTDARYIYEVEDCHWFLRTFSAASIEKARFSPEIFKPEFAKGTIIVVMYGFMFGVITITAGLLLEFLYKIWKKLTTKKTKSPRKK